MSLEVKRVTGKKEKINDEPVVVQTEKLETDVGVLNREDAKGASVYSVEEFAAAARSLFGVGPDLVVAALKSRKLSECTREEAEKAVRDFASKEVK